MAPTKSGKAVKKSGKTQKNTILSNKKLKNFTFYIYKVLKEFHPDISISKKAIKIVNTILNNSFKRIATEASWLAHYNNKATIDAMELQSAVRWLLSGELANHANREGTEAIAKYSSSKLCSEPNGSTLQEIKEHIAQQYCTSHNAHTAILY